jgi:predicted AlkP superfamily pyrophosphatase or phosphodiesterase
MRKFVVLLFISISLLAQPRQAPQAAAKPKLVVAIVVDQFRYDYMTRVHDEFTGGLKRLLDQGAVFTNAHYIHVPTVTAVGHSTFLSGATPAMSGIIANEWWDRESRKRVTSVSDESTQMLGGPGTSSSPRRLLQSTVGDELKMSGKGGKVISVSIKDRSAILPGGHMADGAFWFDPRVGNFVSSTYYFEQLPKWASELNASRPADKFANKEWMGHKMPAVGVSLYDAVDTSPYGNELIQECALKALAAEKLGTGAKIDLLAVSYSSNDYVGHRYGPDAPESRDMAVRVDKLIGELLRAAEAQVGAGRVLAVLTADHGVAPVPEENQRRKMLGGRLNTRPEGDAIEKALSARFGDGKWVADISEGITLNTDTIAAKKADVAEAERIAADAVRALPHIFRVYTRTQLLNGWIANDPVDIRVRNGFNAARSANLTVIGDPYYMGGTSGSTHGTPFDYDTHVPILFLGAQIKPGRYHRNVAPNDIAPTLATLLDVETPSGSVGRVLDEMIK